MFHRRLTLPLLAIACSLLTHCSTAPPVAADGTRPLPEAGEVSPRRAH